VDRESQRFDDLLSPFTFLNSLGAPLVFGAFDFFFGDRYNALCKIYQSLHRRFAWDVDFHWDESLMPRVRSSKEFEMNRRWNTVLLLITHERLECFHELPVDAVVRNERRIKSRGFTNGGIPLVSGSFGQARKT
jgi:hypothetical protein